MKCVSWILDITEWFKTFTDLAGKHSLVARTSLGSKQLHVTLAPRPSTQHPFLTCTAPKLTSTYSHKYIHTLTYSNNYIITSVCISIEYCSIPLRSTVKNVCPKEIQSSTKIVCYVFVFSLFWCCVFGGWAVFDLQYWDLFHLLEIFAYVFVCELVLDGDGNRRDHVRRTTEWDNMGRNIWNRWAFGGGWCGIIKQWNLVDLMSMALGGLLAKEDMESKPSIFWTRPDFQ